MKLWVMMTAPVYLEELAGTFLKFHWLSVVALPSASTISRVAFLFI